MADISQVKLPNGDTYNLVDETSGFSKIHMVEITPPIIDGGAPTLSASYSQIQDWINNEDLVILINVSSGNRYYLSYTDPSTLKFRTLQGYECEITSNATQLSNVTWITLNDLPIYDGTVEDGYN